MTEQAERVYLITRMRNQIFSFLLDGSRAIEIHCDSPGTLTGLQNIYIAKIQKIVQNLDAAFVEISPGTVCYLPLSECKAPVYTKKGSAKKPQAGDELLVQIVREGSRTKAPAVTTNLSLHGKYAVLTAGNKRLSVSSRLSQEERDRLSRLLHEFADSEPEIQEYGWILRTNAGDAEEAAVLEELKQLFAQYQALLQTARYRTCFSCLFSMPPAYLERLTNLRKAETGRLVTDDPELYRQMEAYLKERQPEDLPMLSFYEDHLLPLTGLYSLERHLREATEERVWLKSGGYLVIQPTEALTVIDVNSGKCTAGKEKEATFLRINLEAALETARQLRLRNLSGIIIVDFINMEKKSSEKLLLSTLEEALKQDPVRTALIDMTKLSLVEITRQKQERPLRECIVTVQPSAK